MVRNKKINVLLYDEYFLLPCPLSPGCRAAETIGCRVHGITLSKEQKALAEAKVQY